MANENHSTSQADPHDGRLDELVFEYVDRLNAGEILDKEAIQTDHPEHAEALIDKLQLFEQLGSTAKPQSLGTFGRYEILSEIGRGGMGSVYEALDLDMERRVALKVLPAGLKIQERSVVRFRREARIVGKLRHPNVVAVYATGVEDKTPYIAMELVDGESLEKILERKRPKVDHDSRGLGSRILTGIHRAFTAGRTTTVLNPPPGESSSEKPKESDDSWSQIPSSTEGMELRYSIRTAEMFAAVAEGLQHAHSKGVVHRDLKPSNLILDRDGNLRILDFGLARLEGQESLTASGEVVGTPRYMSPEQVRARRVAIDHRTDIYSLGASLYEMLTLRPPFQGRNAEETLNHILHREPRPLGQLNPRVPRDLETIVFKCLRKDPAERYGTAEALSQDLRRFTRGDPIEARPQSVSEKAVRWVRQHRGKVTAAAAVVLLLAYVSWLAADRAAETRRRRAAEYDKDVIGAVVTLQSAGAVGDSAESFVWSVEWDLSLLSGGFPWSEGNKVRQAIRKLEGARDAVPHRPDAYYHLARGLLLVGDEDRALNELSQAVDRGFIPAMLLKSVLHTRRGELDVARALQQRAQRSGGSDWGDTWLDAHLACSEGRWQDAARAYGNLIELEKSGKGPYLGSSVEAYLGCGLANLRLKNFDTARESFVAAGALWPQSVEPELFLGVTYKAQGDEREAETIFERMYQRRPSDEVASTIAALYGLRYWDFKKSMAWAERLQSQTVRDLWQASCLTELGRHEEAMAAAKKLVEDHPDMALAWAMAVDVVLDTGPRGEKELQLAEAWARELAALAPRSGLPYTFLAMVRNARGDSPAALEMWRKAVEVEPTSPRARYNLGTGLRRAGQLEEAVHTIREAIELSHGSRGGMFGTGLPQLTLGEILEQLGRVEEARNAYRQGVELAVRVKIRHPSWASVLPLIAKAQFAIGQLSEAVRSVGAALESPLAPVRTVREMETRFLEYAQAARPDLPTYRAVDLALASIDETALVKKGATWKYLKGTQAPSPGIEWTQVDFADGGWESGASGLGYGDGDDATVLDDMRNTYSTLYTRHTFEVSDPAEYLQLAFWIRVDDGFVAYLNGNEVWRDAVDSAVVIPHSALATGAVLEPILPLKTVVPTSLLRPGKNVLAVQGVNATLGSSDFSLIPELKGVRPPDAKRGDKLLEDLREVARGADAESRIAYLEGRLLQQRQRHEQAAERFATALQSDPGRPELVLALAESLRADGRPQEAERNLREALETTSPRVRDLWDAWAAVSLADLRRSPGEIASDLPRTKASGANCQNELRWLLECLGNGEPIRINCGGGRYESEHGTVWESDRFCIGGGKYLEGRATFEGPIANTEDDPLYQTERYFGPEGGSAPGYRIPLPPGSYRAKLHFAEIYFDTPGARVFDLSLEGTKVLERYDPCVAGFGAARTQSFEIAVKDGLLNIEFGFQRENPKISAIEIESVE